DARARRAPVETASARLVDPCRAWRVVGAVGRPSRAEAGAARLHATIAAKTEARIRLLGSSGASAGPTKRARGHGMQRMEAVALYRVAATKLPVIRASDAHLW